MATRQEIIDIIDAFLENRITLREAIEWAQMELNRTPSCEDPPSALVTFVGSDVPEEVLDRPVRDQLLMDREVLVHGVPCPSEELGKTVEAFWLAYTPWEKIVLCQIKITDEDRILEVTEEAWDGTQLFHEEIPLPLKDGNDSPSNREEIYKKRDAYWSGKITAEKFLQWLLYQLQREKAVREYDVLLHFYWEVRREDHLFTIEYVEGQNKAGYIPEALLKLVESVRKREEERKRKENRRN